MHKKVCVYLRLRLQSSSCGRGLRAAFPAVNEKMKLKPQNSILFSNNSGLLGFNFNLFIILLFRPAKWFHWLGFSLALKKAAI